MTWVFLSILSAFGQAFGWALKKRSLQNRGLNNTLGLVSYLVAGIILLLWWGIATDWLIPPMSERFIWASGAIIYLNIVAVWTAYRALDRGMFSFLMPFIALTAILIVPIEYFLRGMIPSGAQVLGIFIVVAGAIVMTFRGLPEGITIRLVLYFSITVFCYAFSSVFGSIAIQASGDGLFSAVIYHFGIALGFLLMTLFSSERATLRGLHVNGQLRNTIFFMAFAGIVIALLENGPSSLALEQANASEVFALKRTMPLFALILGISLFHEKVTRWHILGIVLLIIGSGFVVWYK